MTAKNMLPRAFTLLAAGILTLPVSCGKDTASVEGRAAGADKETVVLEMVSLGNDIRTDTTVTDRDGNFRFRTELPSGQTTLYNIKIDGASIPLFISPEEKIVMTLSYGNPRSYEVKGSPESELLKEITDLLGSGAQALDSMYKVSLAVEDENLLRENALAYTKEYQRIKRGHIEFIMVNRGTLAAVYALNQRLPGDEYLSVGTNDIVYYREVAEYAGETYPGSPYVAALKREIANYDATMALAEEVAGKVENPAPFPEIEMPDRYGNLQKLSDRLGKVVVLDFWSGEFPEAAVMNAEYKELYEEFAGRGLEIFQVSIDDSRPDWVTAVQEQQIPWTTVFDVKRTGSTAARNYNITELPANYLIRADGEIAGRNIFGDKLRAEIVKALEKTE